MAILIVICGLPGTGKTTFASALADALDAEHLNTDKIRYDAGKRGQYSEHAKEDIYESLLDAARSVLSKGRSAVLDGTFYREKLRKPFEHLATAFKVRLSWIELIAAEETVRERVSKTRPYSEADYEVYLKIKNAFEPLPGAHLTLDSGVLSMEEMLQQASAYLRDIDPSSPEYAGH